MYYESFGVFVVSSSLIIVVSWSSRKETLKGDVEGFSQENKHSNNKGH